MELLRYCIGWILVIGSIAGWAALLREKVRLVPEMAVPAAAAGIVLVVYAGGLCSLLAPSAWCAAGAGFALCVWSIVRKWRFWREFPSAGTLFLVLFAIFIAWQVSDDHLSHNDDFNHWAVIVRNMLLRDAFPDSSVSAIDFASYPPGSAVFNYFVNRVGMTAGREGDYIFAQNLLVILFLNPLFLCMRTEPAEKKGTRFALYGMLCACCVLIFLYEFRALVVDVLNGVIGFAALAGVLYERKDPKKAVLYALPVTALGLLVKYSNIYYAAITLLALWLCIRAQEKRERRASLATLIAAAAGGTALVLAWFLHVRAAFGGITGTHSMSASRMQDVLAGWSREDIRTIVTVCLRNAVAPRNSSVLLTIFMNCAALGLALWNKVVYKRSAKRLVRSVCIADAAYAGYQFMLLCAYLLSFPREEALQAASYRRYNMSIMIWVIGFLSGVCVHELRELGRDAWTKVYAVAFALVTVCALLFTGEGATLWTEIPYEGTKQQAADRILAENTFDGDDAFIVLAADDDAKQVASVFHYKVNRHVDFVRVDEVTDRSALAQAVRGYDYLIILENDPRIEALLGQGNCTGAYEAASLQP